jgi:hypothetical protein
MPTGTLILIGRSSLIFASDLSATHLAGGCGCRGYPWNRGDDDGARVGGGGRSVRYLGCGNWPIGRGDGNYLGNYRSSRGTAVGHLRSAEGRINRVDGDGGRDSRIAPRVELLGATRLPSALAGVGAAMIPPNRVAAIADRFAPAERGSPPARPPTREERDPRRAPRQGRRRR